MLRLIALPFLIALAPGGGAAEPLPLPLEPSRLALEPSRLTLVIHHRYAGRPLGLDEASLSTPAGERIALSRLAYLLAEPALRGTGGEWLGNGKWFGFVDAAKGDATLELAGLPRGRFEALRFHVGPDAATDKADPSGLPPRHPLNPAVNGLHWGWSNGFVYLALEGRLAKGAAGGGASAPVVGTAGVAGSGAAAGEGGASAEAARAMSAAVAGAGTDGSGFSFHLAGAANRAEITLPAVIDLAQDVTVELDFEVDRLLAGEPPLVIAAQNSTHSREGDALAGRLRKQAEQAFAVRSLHATEAKPLPAAAGASAPLVGTPYRFTVGRGFPLPDLPTDFPLTNERVELGRLLFHETRLSRTNSQSCATCHDPTFAFSDPRRFSAGVDGDRGTRQSMPLFNVAWKRAFFWDGRAPSLRKQALEPIENPIEMHETLPHVVEKLGADAALAGKFVAAFGSTHVSAERIGLALEAFVLTLTSFDSRFDRSLRGEAELSPEEKRGFELFVTEYDPRREQFGADCFHCHGGALFTDYAFRNNGLPIDAADLGRASVTHREADRGKFATPSLRNVALTAPYMHDGRFQTLEEVIEHYDHGVRATETLDPNLAKHPAAGLKLSAADKAALVAFLKTLSDPQFTRR